MSTQVAAQPWLEFALALAIGGLVGIEREQKKRAGGSAIGGLRTFILVAEAGAIAAWLAQVGGSPWIFAAAGGMVALLVLAGYWLENRMRSDALGITTEVAILVVYLLGGMVAYGETRLAVALAIATSAVLTFKEPLHGFVARIGGDDLRAGLKLLVSAFVVLPVLPREPVDPWGVLVPYTMWWMVILISGLSLAGYVATRWLGSSHGLALTALAGGLVSSTAVTLSFARKSRESDLRAPAAALAGGILLSWGVMFARVLVTAALVHRPLARELGPPLATLALLSLGGAALTMRRGARTGPGPAPALPVKNPFRLLAAVRFALLLAAIKLLVELAQRRWPGSGAYTVALLAGTSDVDAITLSMAELARSGAGQVPATAILLAVLSNTLAKLGLVIALGTRGLATELVPVTLAVLAGGGAVLLLG